MALPVSIDVILSKNRYAVFNTSIYSVAHLVHLDEPAVRRKVRALPAALTVGLALGLAAHAVRASGAASDPQGGDLTIVNARIYASPEASAIDPGTLVIRNGRIVSVRAATGVPAAPADANTIDVKGAVVVAGFWNSHVHIFTPPLLDADARSARELGSALQSMLTRYGFTSVFDVASLLTNTERIRARIASGEVSGPRILTVGDPFFPEHGTPVYVRQYLEEHHFPSFEVANAAEAAERARRQLAAGADGVKIFTGAIVGGDAGVLPMPPEIASAVVREAHRAGKPAFAHPSNAAGVEIALGSGVDVLAHAAPMMGPWSPQLAARLRAHKIALVPTLTLFEVEEKKAGSTVEATAQVEQVATQQLGAFAKAGGLILFGTDVGYIDVYDTTRELELMSRVIGWRAILASLTTNPARRFTGESGTLRPGAAADLVVLEDDPAKDPTAFARVRYTVRAGRLIYMRPRAGAECRSHRHCD